ncbi:MAG: hypothetical protein J6D16_04710 [Clostridia bacterium]|nr:hypothetical protein [Clostridia bacterium]
MTELEKIAYAKSFIDSLANGINPLSGAPVPEDDLVNNIRISRCLFYVSGILQSVIAHGGDPKPRSKKVKGRPFSILPEQLEGYVCSTEPISATAVCRKLNWLVPEVKDKVMKGMTARHMIAWLESLDLVERRELSDGIQRNFATPAGEGIGLKNVTRYGYGGKHYLLLFSEQAQQFVIDNIDALSAFELAEKLPEASEED